MQFSWWGHKSQNPPNQQPAKPSQQPPRHRLGFRFKRDYLVPGPVTEERVRVNVVDEMQSMGPFIQGLKTLGKNISPHLVRAALEQRDPFLLKGLVQPVGVNAMSAAHVPHGRVLARRADLYHGSIVLMEDTHRFALQDSVPEG